MKKILLTIYPVLLLLFPLSCKEECCQEEVLSPDQALNGSWLLYERGYSPGSGYVIDKVSPKPAQKITFRPDNTLTSTVKGLTQFKFYSTAYDSVSDDLVLNLYEDQPQDTSQVASSFSVEMADGNLKLMYHYCIEGCHLGFRRIGGH